MAANKPLCRGCMREAHPGLSCTENALRRDFGKRVGKRPTMCKRCLREHWPFQACALRSREEEEGHHLTGG